MSFLRKTPKKAWDGKGRKRLSLYPKSSTSKEPIKKSSPQPNPDSKYSLLNITKRISYAVAATLVTLAILQLTGVVNLFNTENGEGLFDDSNANPLSNSGENQVTDKGESTSSWTGTYTIESFSTSIFSESGPDCQSIITGEIHFEITQKSNGNFTGIITTKNEKEEIILLDESFADLMPNWCISWLARAYYGEGEHEGEPIPFWLRGTINDAGGLNIEYFEMFMVSFSSFTANRVGDTLTSEHIEVDEYDSDSQKLTFSVTKDA